MQFLASGMANSLAHIVTALVALIHVYIVLIETVLFQSRGRRVFGLSQEKAEMMRASMSNQGCYNGFLVAALVVGWLHPDAATGTAFTVFGLCCVAVAGVWGAVTVKRSILYIQTLPAALALALTLLAH
jgi:putative membrane protein